MHRSLWCVLASLVMSMQSSPGQVADVKEFTLRNGLRVLMVEDHTVPSVCFATVFLVGNRNEKPGMTGISHLFEHMMFNGSRKYRPTEFDNILESGGGYSNAYTGHDITFYFEEFNPDLLDKVLDMEADRMRALKLDSENLEQERGIVQEERRVGTDNDIRGKMFEDLYATAFMVHPYRHPIGGWMKDLDNITLQNAKQYFQTYYAPNNATVIVVGAFDDSSLQRKIGQLFGAIPRGPTPPTVNNAEPPQLGERRIKLHKLAELPAIAIGYKGAPVSSPDFYALDLLTTILCTGQSSRLYTRLVHELQVAADVGGGVEECVDPGLVVFYVQSQPGKSIEDAEEELYRIVADVAENGVREEELQKAKNFAQMTYASEFKTNVGIADRLARFEAIYGGYKLAFDMPKRYMGVTTEEIRKVARAYLSERQRSVVVLVPESTDEHPAEQRSKE